MGDAFLLGVGEALATRDKERVSQRESALVEATLQHDAMTLVRGERHAISFLAKTLLKQRYMTGDDAGRTLHVWRRDVFFRPFPLDYEDVAMAA